MSWSKEENNRFEQALFYFKENHPDRWQLVAQAVGGGKTAEDARQHFLELNWDIHDMGVTERMNRRRELYHQQHQNGAADANGANNSRNDRQRRTNGGGGGSSSNNRANRPQA